MLARVSMYMGIRVASLAWVGAAAFRELELELIGQGHSVRRLSTVVATRTVGEAHVAEMLAVNLRATSTLR